MEVRYGSAGLAADAADAAGYNDAVSWQLKSRRTLAREPATKVARAFQPGMFVGKLVSAFTRWKARATPKSSQASSIWIDIGQSPSRSAPRLKQEARNQEKMRLVPGFMVSCFIVPCRHGNISGSASKKRPSHFTVVFGEQIPSRRERRTLPSQPQQPEFSVPDADAISRIRRFARRTPSMRQAGQSSHIPHHGFPDFPAIPPR